MLKLGEVSASEPFAELVFWALDYGIECVSTGETLIPFVAVLLDGKRQLRRLLAEGPEAAERMLEHMLAQEPMEAYAYAYDGYVTLEGERSDAVFVEGAERGVEKGVLFVQRYRPANHAEGFAVRARPALIEYPNSRLAGSDG